MTKLVCGASTLVNHTRSTLKAKTLRCRSWTCDDCRPRRHAQLVAEGIAGRPNRFVTLTLRRDDTADPTAQAKRLSRAWRLICKRVARDGGGKVEYLARLELTPKNRTPHLHVLVRSKWIDQRQLSLWAAELLDAPNVWIERIDQAKNVASYIAKYLAKDDTKIGTCKRYWKSKGYDLRPPREKAAPLWRYGPDCIEKQPIAQVAAGYERIGFAVTWDGPDRFNAVEDCWPWNPDAKPPGPMPWGPAPRATAPRAPSARRPPQQAPP